MFRRVDSFDYTSRNASYHRVSLDVFSDYAASSDGRSVADCHARQNSHIAPDPDRFTNGDGLGENVETTTWVERMIGRVDVDARSEKRKIANANLVAVENHAMVVDEHAFSQMYVGAVVAREWYGDLVRISRICAFTF